jgi:hypothetical protein
MSRKHNYNLKKWQCLIKECQSSGKTVVGWCAANGVPKSQYYYWLAKIREGCSEEAVAQLPTVKAINKTAGAVKLQGGSFVEIMPVAADASPVQTNYVQPVAAVQTGGVRIEIMSNAPASFIRQLLEAACHA